MTLLLSIVIVIASIFLLANFANSIAAITAIFAAAMLALTAIGVVGGFFGGLVWLGLIAVAAVMNLSLIHI